MVSSHDEQKAEARRVSLLRAGIRTVFHTPLLAETDSLLARQLEAYVRADDFANPRGAIIAGGNEARRLTMLTAKAFHLNKGGVYLDDIVGWGYLLDDRAEMKKRCRPVRTLVVTGASGGAPFESERQFDRDRIQSFQRVFENWMEMGNRVIWQSELPLSHPATWWQGAFVERLRAHAGENDFSKEARQ